MLLASARPPTWAHCLGLGINDPRGGLRGDRAGVGAGTSCSRGSVPMGHVLVLSPPLQAGAEAKNPERRYLGGHPLGQGLPSARHPSGLRCFFPILLCSNLLFDAWSREARGEGAERNEPFPPTTKPKGRSRISERLPVPAALSP